jgi:hypothetical protein
MHRPKRPRRTRRQLGPRSAELLHTCLHEAGHAVARDVQGLGPALLLAAERRGRLAGYTLVRDPFAAERPDRQTVMAEAIASLAGEAVALRVEPKARALARAESSADYDDVHQSLQLLFPSGKRRAALRSLRLRARRLVNAAWPAILALAERLMVRRRLTGRAARAIVKRALMGRAHQSGRRRSPASPSTLGHHRAR